MTRTKAKRDTRCDFTYKRLLWKKPEPMFDLAFDFCFILGGTS